jgi:hypothetical protein
MFKRSGEEVFAQEDTRISGNAFRIVAVDSAKEGYPMTSGVICFLLGTVFPLAMVGWLIVQG